MSIFNHLGNMLNEAFAASGERLLYAYDLGGGMIYTAKALDETFDGAHRVWRFKQTADKSWQTVTIPHDFSIRKDFNAQSPSTYEGGWLDGGEAVSLLV